MFAKRHPLVWAFAGGCLSGAALIGFWPEDARTVPHRAADARPVERNREPTAVPPVDDDARATDVADDDPNAASDDPGPPQTTPQKTVAVDAASSTETGNSVADVLIRLEVLYRQHLAVPSPQPTAVTPQAPQIPVHVNTAVAVTTPPAPPANAPPANAPPARAPEADPQPRLASRDDARPRDVYLGEVHQNTNVGTVNEGDVYVVQNVVEYVPFFARAPHAGVASPAYAPRPVTPARAVHFTNPSATSDFGVFKYPGEFKYPVDLVH